ncbi:MAG: GFA family protein [Xanthomonadales bacterium]|nr:GFA family protein [Xanthomonadales bacterium]MDH4019511.1 GFA family protein [Xanthomonadales bacterium]
MSDKPIDGSCLCKTVSYRITGNMGVFQYCHCSRCRKFTGSAHAANLFVSPDQFSWLSGEGLVGRYDPLDTKYFATCFCKNCGSSLPWLSKSGKVVIIPAGTLDEDPGFSPTKNIFYGSRANWYTHVSDLPEHDEMPPRKT